MRALCLLRLHASGIRCAVIPRFETTSRGVEGAGWIQVERPNSLRGDNVLAQGFVIFPLEFAKRWKV